MIRPRLIALVTDIPNYDIVPVASILRAAFTGDCGLTNEECVPFQMYTHGSSDGMPTGWQPWGLCFVRTRAGWRLYDQRQG